MSASARQKTNNEFVTLDLYNDLQSLNALKGVEAAIR